LPLEFGLFFIKKRQILHNFIDNIRILRYYLGERILL